MTKIIENNNITAVHSHIDEAYSIISKGINKDYVNLVLPKFTEDASISSGIIRNIKNRVTPYPKTRINVLIALVEVAKEYQLQLEKLKKLTTNDVTN